MQGSYPTLHSPLLADWGPGPGRGCSHHPSRIPLCILPSSLTHPSRVNHCSLSPGGLSCAGRRGLGRGGALWTEGRGATESLPMRPLCPERNPRGMLNSVLPERSAVEGHARMLRLHPSGATLSTNGSTSFVSLAHPGARPRNGSPLPPPTRSFERSAASC